jgi:multiple sugar transport system ATP-binding protein
MARLLRPSKASITNAAKGSLKGEVYATELIGDHTLVTLKVNGEFLAVKAAKDFVAKLGEVVGVRFAKESMYLFDAVSGARVR